MTPDVVHDDAQCGQIPLHSDIVVRGERHSPAIAQFITRHMTVLHGPLIVTDNLLKRVSFSPTLIRCEQIVKRISIRSVENGIPP